MADAYRCDRCDEYDDGSPTECWAGKVDEASYEAELCDKCATLFDDVAQYFLWGDSE